MPCLFYFDSKSNPFSFSCNIGISGKNGTFGFVALVGKKKA
jgi:hypothetical protein